MTEEKTFTGEFCKAILANQFQEHTDNYNHLRYGPEKKEVLGLTGKLKRSLKAFLSKRNFQNAPVNNEHIVHAISKLDAHFPGLEKTYNLLADGYSKDIFVKLMAYWVLGYKHVKLPLNEPGYWNTLEQLKTHRMNGEKIDTKFGRQLHKYDLSKNGYPIKLYFSDLGIMADFQLKQYEYDRPPVKVGVTAGDHVVDAGACWGDTALAFAHDAGPNGRVYSFEFIPSNIELFRKNTGLNPELEQRITLLQHPVWNEAKTMYYKDWGPSSTVSFDKPEAFDGSVESASIDQMVENGSIERVDFIKMDIEGAEHPALRGAEQTLRKFKPKLAIALYHSLDDFANIPAWLDSLGLGYEFYLDHYTIHREETILYAIPTGA